MQECKNTQPLQMQCKWITSGDAKWIDELPANRNPLSCATMTSFDH